MNAHRLEINLLISYYRLYKFLIRTGEYVQSTPLQCVFVYTIFAQSHKCFDASQNFHRARKTFKATN